jgi:regulator of protease activity HflC (stomatin/prohibitin superfamily)
MNKISKEIRKSVEEAINAVLLKFEITSATKKSAKLLNNFSRKFTDEVKRIMKRKAVKAENVKKPARKTAKKPIKKNK